MNLSEKILALVSSALDDLNDTSCSLAAVTRKAVRVARLRNDYVNLWWLENELMSSDEKDKRWQIIVEMLPHFSKKDYEATRKHIVEIFIEERAITQMLFDEEQPKDKVLPLSVDELEARRSSFRELLKGDATPQGLNPADLYRVDKDRAQARIVAVGAINDLGSMLSKIRNRLNTFLSATETELAGGKLQSDVFESNRRYVDAQLTRLIPGVADQMKVAFDRLEEDNDEARSQALTTCRRAFKAVADHVYPANNGKITSRDGTERCMTEDKYISRLWQFIDVQVGATRSGELLLANVTDIGNRIDRIYSLSSKGVHGAVNPAEANQCVVQTYMLIGDILRIIDGTTSIHGAEKEE